MIMCWAGASAKSRCAGTEPQRNAADGDGDDGDDDYNSPNSDDAVSVKGPQRHTGRTLQQMNSYFPCTFLASTICTFAMRIHSWTSPRRALHDAMTSFMSPSVPCMYEPDVLT